MTVVALNSMRELLPAAPLPFGNTVMLLLPALATVSVNVVPAGKVCAVALGSEKLKSVGVAALGGEVEFVTLVLKPLLAVSVTVTLRAPGNPLERVSQRRTGMAPAAIENVCCIAGVIVHESGAPLTTVSFVSAAVGTTRDSERAPPPVRCR